MVQIRLWELKLLQFDNNMLLLFNQQTGDVGEVRSKQ